MNEFELEELLMKLIDAYNNLQDYSIKSDYVVWSEKAENEAREKYYNILNQIIEICARNT